MNGTGDVQDQRAEGRRADRIGWFRRERRQAKQAPGRSATGALRVARLIALVAIAVLVLAASGVSFAESYRGLFLWAHRHGLSGPWAAIWPRQVDVFVAVGELALFVALADQWPVKSRVAAWTVTLAGLALSVAGNVGHVTGHSVTDRATAAVPPLAVAAALAVGLGVLKRVWAPAPGRTSCQVRPGGTAVHPMHSPTAATHPKPAGKPLRSSPPG